MPALYWSVVSRTESRAARDGRVLTLASVLEDAERREVVLDVLERGEHGLAIVRDASRRRRRGPGPSARRARPPSKTVSVTDGPSDQKRLGHVNQCASRRSRSRPTR